MHVLEQAARFAVAFRARAIEAPLLHHAKRALIDWHSALLPGAVLPPATLLERALADDLDRGGARLALGPAGRRPRRGADQRHRRRTPPRSTTSFATPSTTPARRPSPPRWRWRRRAGNRARSCCAP